MLVDALGNRSVVNRGGPVPSLHGHKRQGGFGTLMEWLGLEP